jgi:hypothetical protein
MIVQHTHLKSTNLHGGSSIQQSVIFGKEDESRFLKDMDNQSRIERLTQVRQQEKEASRSLVQRHHTDIAMKKEREEKES